jgi:TRAP transporter 4TM/12TM fusion protein
VGLPILVVAAGFIIYAFVYQFNFATTTLYSALRRVVHQLFYTTDGIIGTPIGVCSTFIVLFIFLAAFLEKSGIANFFIDLANSIAGYASGGPAKVAVIASGFEGIYTGSSIANTVGSGSVTIPTMKKNGYQPEFAAAVEAAASTGGQIVPPIMGAAAFLMAEMTGIPYPVIALSALVPALLYFTGIFLAVHFEAKKLGLKGLPKDQMPHFGKLVLRRGYLLLPIVVLVSFMSLGFTPAYAACIAIISVYVVSFFRKDTRFSAAGLLDAITTGSRNTIGVGIACAVAGTIVGIVSLTGIGQLLSSAIVTIVKNPILLSTGTSLLVALLLTMVSCLILGMGVPTTANYVIMATITAPMVIQTGKLLGVDVPLLAAHMFVFYFGIAADITPPVALASFAGAAIAKSDPMKTAVTATMLAIVVFIVPYVFVFNPAMLFIDASFLSILQAVVTTTIGMFGIAVGLAGFCFRRVPVIGRLAIIAGGLCCINPGIIADIAGTLLIALVTVFQIVMWRREQRRDKRGNL